MKVINGMMNVEFRKLRNYSRRGAEARRREEKGFGWDCVNDGE
jgi:hypothetical protein